MEFDLCFEGVEGLKKKDRRTFSLHEKQTMPGAEKEIPLESAGRAGETINLDQRSCVGG